MGEKSKDMCASGGNCEGICRQLHRIVPVRDKKNIPTGEKRLCAGAYIKQNRTKRRKRGDDEPRQQQEQRFDAADKYKGLFDY